MNKQIADKPLEYPENIFGLNLEDLGKAVQFIEEAMAESRQAFDERFENHERRLWEIAIRHNKASHIEDVLVRKEMSAFMAIPAPDELNELLYEPDQWFWDTNNDQPVYVLREFDFAGQAIAEVRYFDPINESYLGTPAGTVYIRRKSLIPIQSHCVLDL